MAAGGLRPWWTVSWYNSTNSDRVSISQRMTDIPEDDRADGGAEVGARGAALLAELQQAPSAV
jgi:hypothetical protein